MDNAIKQKLLDEFETMRLIESDARQFYLKASNDPKISERGVRNCFGRIAEDELRHVELVEQVMNIIRNCL